MSAYLQGEAKQMVALCGRHFGTDKVGVFDRFKKHAFES